MVNVRNKVVMKDLNKLIEYDNKYLINEYGDIYSKRKKYLFKLSGTITNKGYIRMTLRINGKQKNKFLHRVIAETFIPNPNKYTQINHKDGNKQNNRVDNLEWCNNSYNQLHAYRVLKTQCSKGSNNGRAKLNEDIVYILKQLLNKKALTQVEISKKFNINKAVINDINTGRRWAHVC